MKINFLKGIEREFLDYHITRDYEEIVGGG